MEFISSMTGLYKTFCVTRTISGLFINRTIQVLNRIGQKELDAAIKCLHDAEISNNPEREFTMALTLLKSSLEKFSDSNKLKFQCACIIAICYYVIDEFKLSDKYINFSKSYFSKWIYERRPVRLMSVGFIRMGYFNYTRCRDFRNELQELGLKWKGQPGIPLEFCTNFIFMNKEIRLAVDNAIQEYHNKMDSLFLRTPCYFFYCPKCNERKEFVKLDTFETQEDILSFPLYSLLGLSVFKCSICGERIKVNEETELELDKDGNFTKKSGKTSL